MNATAGLAGNTTRVWDFVTDAWNLAIPSGQYRYYDGMLYMMALLHLSGNFKMYAPGAALPPATNTPLPQPTNTPVPGATNTPIPAATNTPVPQPTNTPSGGGGGGAYVRIEAETFISSGNVNVQATGDSGGGGSDALMLNSNSYISFENLDFGSNGPASVQIRAATTLSGVNVVFRTGSPTGQEICRVYPSSSGNYETGSNTCWPRPTGVQTIYVTVTGGPVKLNWFQFQP
jgi:hypothetical protein